MLASLNTKTGDIVWRKILEKNNRGSVRFLHVPQPSKAVGHIVGGDDTVDLIDAVDSLSDPDVLITVSGQSPALVRGWHSLSGHAEFEWTLTPSNSSYSASSAVVADSQHHWIYASSHLYHIVPVWGSHMELTAYVARTGQPVRPSTRRISAAWSSAQNCVITQRLLVCLTENGLQLVAVDLTTDRNELLTRRLQNGHTGDVVSLQTLRGAEDSVVVAGIVYALRDSEPMKAAVVSTSGSSAFVAGDDLLVQAAVKGSVSIILYRQALASFTENET